MSQIFTTFDYQKKSDDIHHSNDKDRNSANHEKIKVPNIKLNAYNIKYHRINKQDSLLSLSPSSNYDESLLTIKQQLQQIELKKSENKNKMIEDFTDYIAKQQHLKGNKEFRIEKINNLPQSNSVLASLQKMPTILQFKSDTKLKLNDIQENRSHVQFKDDLLQNTNNEIPKRKINRQNTIFQAIQKKLKIFHKSKEQLFNEKLQLFQGVSTYIETKQYLQNLNLLNKKNLIEGMKKNQQWNEEFNEFRKKQQCYCRYEIQENSYNNKCPDKTKQKSFLKNKFDVDNPNYDQNINTLLEKAHYVIDSRLNNNAIQNKSMNYLDDNMKNSFIQYMNDFTLKNDFNSLLDNTDENQFYEQLKILFIQNKQQDQIKQDEHREQEILKEQQQKKYEVELLNEIYANRALSDQLTYEQIKQLVAQQVKQKFDPETLKKEQNIKDQFLAGLNIDLKNTNLDAKSQYQEYVEKAKHVRKTLKRLNENLFKQKWANALMKRKQKNERFRNQIIKQIQNNEIVFNKIDALFPSKRKMQHIKSKVNSNIDKTYNGNYVVCSNSFESNTPKQTVKQFLEVTNVDSQNTKNIFEKKSNLLTFRSSQDINPIKSINDLTKTNGFTKKNEQTLSSIPHSLKNIDFKESARTIQQSNSVINCPSGFQRKKQSISFAEEQKQKQKEMQKNQYVNQSQEKLKSEVLQNIENFQSKKSRAPSLSAINLPKIESNNTLNTPMKTSHMIEDSYKQKRSKQHEQQYQNKSTQFKMNCVSKASSNVGSITLKDTDQSLNSPIKSFSKSSINLDKSINTNNIKQKTNSIFSGCLSPSMKQNEQFKSANSFSNLNLDPIYDTSVEKGKLIQIIQDLETEKKKQRKESRDIYKQILQVQDDCSNDLNKLKGDKLGSIQNILDLDFMKFSMKSRPHIHDINIKNFLNQND